MLVGWKFFEMVNVSTSCQVASGLQVVGIEWFRFHALHLNTEQEGEEQWGIVLTMNGGAAARRWIPVRFVLCVNQGAVVQRLHLNEKLFVN
jgi:hypothetical protein